MQISHARVTVLLLLVIGGLVAGLLLRRAIREVPLSEEEAPVRVAAHAVEYSTVRPRDGLAVEAGDGQPRTRVACSTCHSLMPDTGRTMADPPPDDFHQGLTFKHGTLACTACHHPDNYDFLTLSGGKQIRFERVRQVCAQCHPGQARSYEYGAHGGMNGYWDLSRGGRVRNDCVVCHNPHKPAYGRFAPERGPTEPVVPHHVGAGQTQEGGHHE